MLRAVLALLTGSGLAASAGLNAYIPLLALGLLARYTDLVALPSGWQWLADGWALAILTVLLAVEFIADKVPVLDSVNDAVQTFVRPTAGGLAFGAGAGAQTVTVTDPGAGGGEQWLAIVAGAVLAFGVHLLKAAARPVINAVTAGIGGPVVSTAEDAASVVMSLIAIVVPVLVVLFLVGLLGAVWWVLRRRRRRRHGRAHPTLPTSRAGRESPTGDRRSPMTDRS